MGHSPHAQCWQGGQAPASSPVPVYWRAYVHPSKLDSVVTREAPGLGRDIRQARVHVGIPNGTWKYVVSVCGMTA